MSDVRMCTCGHPFVAHVNGCTVCLCSVFREREVGTVIPHDQTAPDGSHRCVCGRFDLGTSPWMDADGTHHRDDGPCHAIETPGELLHAAAGEVLTAALVRPGDTLVVALGHDATMDECERWRRAMLAAMPGLADVLIVADGYVSAVYRPAAVDADGR
jgi:hypothetical protein